MPKETIRCSGFQPDCELDLDRGGLVQVAWGRDTHLGIQTSLPDPTDVLVSALLDAGLDLEEARRIAGIQKDLASGWWIQLDRAGTNALITTLRRARDAAFGKDV